MHWIYTVVVRLILTYSPTVWWPRFGYNVGRMELNKLQGLIGYNRGDEDDPNSSSGGPLGTSPLGAITEADAQVGIC